MAVIRIEERGNGDAYTVAVEIGEHGGFIAQIRPPFEENEDSRLEWYFEEHLRFPFVELVKANAAGASVQTYGERLFEQVFADSKAYAAYESVKGDGLDRLRFEVIGSPDFHKLHWETLKDPQLPPFALNAPMVRWSKKPQAQVGVTTPSPTLNLLVVTARPNVERDVGYRTITRPLVESLQQAGLDVAVDIVRPGTYRALKAALEKAGAGRYHVVHFDVHGALMTWEQFQEGHKQDRLTFDGRFGRDDLTQYAGKRAFLFFEDDAKPATGEADRHRADPTEASEIAHLLLAHQVPIVILNACQSGKQAESEASLASRLVEAGAQTALGMRYSVTVSAAERMIPELYRHLFDGKGLDEAILRARRLLHDDKERRAHYRQTIRLEDWILPVVYQHRRTELNLRPFTDAERAAWRHRQTHLHRGVEPTYGFFGRDIDILRIEKRLLAEGNILLLHGMGGAGKSTLLHHMATWWQKTGFIERVFYFGYDEKAHTRQQIMRDVAEKLYETGRFHGSFLAMDEKTQQADLAHELRAHRHLLILDNLESITGSALAIPNTLTAEEQGKLRDFLGALRGGKSLVLLGSRGREAWLSAASFGANVHELGGLDAESASDLAEKVLARHAVKRPRADAPEAKPWQDDFAALMKLLDGYPLALEVVLSNLKRQAPGEILAALRAGADGVDLKSGSKTESILRCIDYSHGNLSAEAQELLLCLAPFSGVFNAGFVGQYTEALRQQPELAGLAYDRWEEVLREAIDWGLLSGDAEAQGYLRLQPVFPYFLCTRLAGAAQAARKAAIERAFCQHYDGFGGALGLLVQSKEPQEQQLGLAIVELEYANLAEALRLALAQQVSVINLDHPLLLYLDRVQDHERGLTLGEMVLKGLETYPEESLRGSLGAELVGVVDNIGKRYLLLHRYQEAEAAYQRALALVEKLTDFPAEQMGGIKASILHQLGIVAQGQRQWPQAEDYCRQALAIEVEFNDRYNQAGAYGQLGIVAQKQRQWAQAEDYYRQALAIFVEFNDRHNQATVYHQLGRVAQEQRQWAQAEDHYRQALGIYVEFNDRYEQAGTYHQLGIVAQEQRQWPQAEDYYRQALAIYVDFNDRYEQAGTYGQLASLAQLQQQWAQAKQYFLLALTIFAEFDDEHSAAIVLRNLARLWQASGDATLPEDVGKALGISTEEATELLKHALE